MKRQELINYLKSIKCYLNEKKTTTYKDRGNDLLKKAQRDGYSTVEIAAGMYHGKKRK